MTIPDTIYSELTSTRKLTSSSTPRQFRRWKDMIEFVLVDAHHQYVLSDPKPSDPSPDSCSEPSKALEKWISDDKRCRGIILFAMDDLLFDVYSLHKTSKEIMDSLSKTYNPDSRAYRFALYRRYCSHKMAEDTPINDHLNEMCAMAVDLNHAGMPIQQEIQAVLIRSSLPESWEPVETMISLRGDGGLNLEDLMSQLRDWGEMKKEMEDSAEPGSKRQKRGNKGFRGNCYGCGRPGHCQSDCPSKE